MTATKPLIVVPTYNEAENIHTLLTGIHEHAPAADVLFVDDNSRDGTIDLIRRHQEQLPGRIHLLQRPRKMGLGTAYVTGFKWALERGYDVVQEMDADLSHNPVYLPRTLDLHEGHDVNIGSRYIPEGGTENWGLSRRAISGFGNVYARAILGLNIKDLTGGFNAWKREVLQTVSLDDVRSDGYAFQIELKYRAARAGFTLHEIPIIFVDRRVGQSKMSWNVAFEAMIRVWQLWLKRIR